MIRRIAFAMLIVLAVAAIAAARLIPEISAPAAPISPTPISVHLAAEPFRILFTDPIYPDRMENRRPSLDSELVAFISEANTSVDVAVYEFDLEEVAEALTKAKDQGVRVRVVTDQDSLEDRNDAEAARAFEIIRSAGIPVVADH